MPTFQILLLSRPQSQFVEKIKNEDTILAKMALIILVMRDMLAVSLDLAQTAARSPQSQLAVANLVLASVEPKPGIPT